MTAEINSKSLSQKPLGYILAGFAIFLAGAPVKSGGIDACIKKYTENASVAFGSYDNIVSFCGCFIYELSSTISPNQSQIMGHYMLRTGRIHPDVQRLSDQAIFKCQKHTKIKMR